MLLAHRRLNVAGLITVLFLTGCRGGPSPAELDPLGTLRDPDRPPVVRTRAAEELPAAIKSGSVPLKAGRDALIDLAWLRRVPTSMRVAGIRGLFELEDDESIEASIELVQSMLPTERQILVIEYLAFEAANRGWQQCTGAIVRSFSTPHNLVADDERPEIRALEKLHPGRTVAETAFDVFLRPEGPWGSSEQTVPTDGLEQRVRRDAWDLLSRLDRDGSIRVRLLSGLVLEDLPQEDADLDALRAGLRDAAVIPLTGEELQWLVAMRAHVGGKWWEEVVLAVRSLNAEQRRGLRVRHLPAVRWASLNRPAWLTLDTTGLLERLDERISERETKLPGFGVRIKPSEKLADWADELSWAERLLILTLDEAVQTPRVQYGIARSIKADREDRSTEYGGLIESLGTGRPENDLFQAQLYRPRPITRVGDARFVASREMIEDSTPALAHFHFHAQRAENGRFAGPSRGDFEYAERYGRGCLVITSLSEDRINVDYYNPDGAVIDLGSFTLPQSSE